MVQYNTQKISTTSHDFRSISLQKQNVDAIRQFYF